MTTETTLIVCARHFTQTTFAILVTIINNMLWEIRELSRIKRSVIDVITFFSKPNKRNILMSKYLLPSIYKYAVFLQYLEIAICLASLPSIEFNPKPKPYLPFISTVCTGTTWPRVQMVGFNEKKQCITTNKVRTMLF